MSKVSITHKQCAALACGILVLVCGVYSRAEYYNVGWTNFSSDSHLIHDAGIEGANLIRSTSKNFPIWDVAILRDLYENLYFFVSETTKTKNFKCSTDYTASFWQTLNTGINIYENWRDLDHETPERLWVPSVASPKPVKLNFVHVLLLAWLHPCNSPKRACDIQKMTRLRLRALY